MVVTVGPKSVFMWGWGGAGTPCRRMNALHPTHLFLRQLPWAARSRQRFNPQDGFHPCCSHAALKCKTSVSTVTHTTIVTGFALGLADVVIEANSDKKALIVGCGELGGDPLSKLDRDYVLPHMCALLNAYARWIHLQLHSPCLCSVVDVWI